MGHFGHFHNHFSIIMFGAFHHFLQLLNSVLARGEEHMVLDQRFLLHITGKQFRCIFENITYHQVKAL